MLFEKSPKRATTIDSSFKTQDGSMRLMGGLFTTAGSSPIRVIKPPLKHGRVRQPS